MVEKKKRADPKKLPKGEALERVSPLDSSLLVSKRQCPAMSKRTGEQCKNYCGLGLRTCRFHGSGNRRSKVSAAKVIAAASGYSAELLVEFMADPAVDVKLRTNIAQDLLSRSGYNGKTELVVSTELTTYEKARAELLVEVVEVYEDWDDPQPQKALEVVYDAEVVEDDGEARRLAAVVAAQEDARQDEAVQAERERAKRKRAGYSGTTPPVRRKTSMTPPTPPRTGWNIPGIDED